MYLPRGAYPVCLDYGYIDVFAEATCLRHLSATGHYDVSVNHCQTPILDDGIIGLRGSAVKGLREDLFNFFCGVKFCG